MVPDRRDFPLSKDQPILQRARRASRARQRPRAEADFWGLFDLDKLCSYRKCPDRLELDAGTS